MRMMCGRGTPTERWGDGDGRNSGVPGPAGWEYTVANNERDPASPKAEVIF